jgi:hypothetical protein
MNKGIFTADARPPFEMEMIKEKFTRIYIWGGNGSTIRNTTHINVSLFYRLFTNIKKTALASNTNNPRAFPKLARNDSLFT